MTKFIALGLACLLLGSSTCYAGTIYACRKKVGGTVRIVSAKTVCMTTETKMSWPDTAEVTALKNRLAALESLLQHFSRNGNDISISGANLRITDGSGTTDGDTNGLGNLIVGYNEERGAGDDRTGSHNIVVGTNNNYTSFGGLVVGYYNTVSGIYSSVSGGGGNTASGNKSSVSGGYNNTTFGVACSISGGHFNTASGIDSSVSGGYNNTANGEASTVSGGWGNTASGHDSTVSGGFNNTASGGLSSISGGQSNTSSGLYSSVSGGNNNTANGLDSTVSGGGANTALGTAASVSGGAYNVAIGDYSSVSGGGGLAAVDGNNAFAHFSSILGGMSNKAGDPALGDRAIGTQSTVSGGYQNLASGNTSAVSGGAGRSVSGAYDWAAGTLFEEE